MGLEIGAEFTTVTGSQALARSMGVWLTPSSFVRAAPPA